VRPLAPVGRIQDSVNLVNDTVVGKDISLDHLSIVEEDASIVHPHSDDATFKSTGGETIRQLTRNKDLRKDVVEKDFSQSGLTLSTGEEVDGGFRKLGKGAVRRSDQSKFTRASEGTTESGNTNKGKKSAQITVSHNTVGDTVAHPARVQDTVDDIGNTIRGADVTRNDEVSVDFERRTSDRHALAVEGGKEFTIKEHMLVGGDLGTQNVVEEEVGQMRDELIVGEKGIGKARRKLAEGVVVWGEHSQADLIRVEGTIKSSADHSSPKNRQRWSRGNKLEESRLSLGTTELSFGLLK
jgi:hypothetical protein